MTSPTRPLTAEQAIRPALSLQASDKRSHVQALVLFGLAIVLGIGIAGLGAILSYRSLAGKLLSPVQSAAVAFSLHGAITLLVHFLQTLGSDPQTEGFRKTSKLLLWALGTVLFLIALARIQPLLERYSLLPAIAVSFGLFLIELTTPFVAGLLTGHAQVHATEARDEIQASGALVSDLRTADPEARRMVWSQHLTALRERIERGMTNEHGLLDAALNEAERLRKRLETRLHRWSASCPFAEKPKEADPVATAAKPGMSVPTSTPANVAWNAPGFKPNGVPPHQPGIYTQVGPENFQG